MKHTLAIIALVLASTASAREVLTNEMMCDKTSVIFNALKKDYGEIPVVLGKSDDVAKSTMSLWTNPANDSWTIVATKDELSCIVGVGEKLKIIPYNKKNTT